MRHFTLPVAAAVVLMSLVAYGQEATPPAPAAANPAEAVESTLEHSTEAAKKQAGQIAEKVDQNPRAQEVSAGILKQIYVLAEKMESPMFYWVAFALMVSGVVSYALQLVLGKLFVLAKMSFSLTEILSDAMGLVISLVGLVLTTQAAAQNSTFTHSPASVLTSTGLGALVGFVFFRWGTTLELAAADGRRKGQPVPAPVKK